MKIVTLISKTVDNVLKSSFLSKTPTLVNCPFGEFEINSVRIVSDKTSTFRIWFLSENSNVASDDYKTSKVKGWIDLTSPVQGPETIPLYHLINTTGKVKIQYNLMLGKNLPILIENTGSVNDCNLYIEICISVN